MLESTLSFLTEAQKKKFLGIIERWPDFFTGVEIKTFTPELAKVMECYSYNVRRNLELLSKRLGGRLEYALYPKDSAGRACSDPFYEEKAKKGGRRRDRHVSLKWKVYDTDK